MSGQANHKPGEAVPKQVLAFGDKAPYANTVRATAVVFEDPDSLKLQSRIHKIARTGASVLIIGETGTGKELVARQIHSLSKTADDPFIALNCGALPDNIVESELFGHEKGAFTGAIDQKKGWFEAANGGTLFLDEIGDLPLGIQVKLLRVLQQREIFRVGSRTPIPIDIRLIAATNVELETAVLKGRFRQDLYYRLNVATVHLPPLRQRPGDIPALVAHFIEYYRQKLELEQVTISQSAMDHILHYPWPGNIRELENVIHQALIIMTDSTIEVKDLNLSGILMQPLEATASHTPAPAEYNRWTAASDLTRTLTGIFQSGGKNIYSHIDEQVIKAAFEFCHHNQVQTAKLLGISRNILRHRMKLHGMI